MQCLQVDDVIPILSPAVYCGFGRCCSQRFARFDGCIAFYSSFGFQQGDNIGITSFTCRHCTLSNSVMCDSYPIPILSLFFLYHPYIPYFLFQRIFHFLVSFLFFTACMFSHQVYNSSVGLDPKIGLDKFGWLFLFICTLLLCKSVSPSLCIVRFVVKLIVYKHVNT